MLLINKTDNFISGHLSTVLKITELLAVKESNPTTTKKKSKKTPEELHMSKLV